jgi:hypothetical protein
MYSGNLRAMKRMRFVLLAVWQRVAKMTGWMSYQYPFEGELFPLQEMDHENHHGFWLPIFFLLTWSYTFVGVAGAWQSVGNIRPVHAGSFHRYQHFTGCSPGLGLSWICSTEGSPGLVIITAFM